MASTWAKMGPKALKRGKKWSKAATGGQVGLIMGQKRVEGGSTWFKLCPRGSKWLKMASTWVSTCA